MRMENSVLAPTPTRMENETMAIIRGKLRVTPASPWAPMPCPMNMRSTMLYSAWTSMPTMEGMEKRSSRRRMGSVPMQLVLSVAGAELEGEGSMRDQIRRPLYASVRQWPTGILQGREAAKTVVDRSL